MITVKEYADSRNKSVQAVYKQLHREKNRTRLEGHLLKQNRMTYLDEEAIKILDESQNVSIVLNVLMCKVFDTVILSKQAMIVWIYHHLVGIQRGHMSVLALDTMQIIYCFVIKFYKT